MQVFGSQVGRAETNLGFRWRLRKWFGFWFGDRFRFRFLLWLWRGFGFRLGFWFVRRFWFRFWFRLRLRLRLGFGFGFRLIDRLVLCLRGQRSGIDRGIEIEGIELLHAVGLHRLGRRGFFFDGEFYGGR
jgi:hypothetical protein